MRVDPDNHGRAELDALLRRVLGTSAGEAALNWIGGEAHAGEGKEIALVCPATGGEMMRYRDAGAALTGRAVACAARAQRDWQRLSAGERGRRLWRAVCALEGHEEDLAWLECLNAGKPIRDCRAEVAKAREMIEYYAGWADKLHGEVIPVPTTHLNYTRRLPYGVVGQITPWNAPLFTCAWQLAPALATGNAVVLKPSELTPVTSAAFAKLLEAGGLPPGLVNIVNGLGQSTGATLCGHPDVAKIVFVGSPPTGRLVARQAAERLVPSVLELGGKSANIVFADASIDQAVAGAQAAIYAAAGQSCVAGSRLLVERPAFEQVCDRVARAAATIRVGAPWEESTRMGPLQNRAQWQRVNDMVDRARAAGAKCLTGGGRPLGDPLFQRGHFFAPTVLAGPARDSEIAREEVFGPVLTVLAFDDEADAIDLANGTRFGLAGAVWTQDPARAHRVAGSLRAGTVWINSYKAIGVMSPFGGFGQSGYGRSSGTDALHEYTLPQSVWTETAETATIASGYGTGEELE